MYKAETSKNSAADEMWRYNKNNCVENGSYNSNARRPIVNTTTFGDGRSEDNKPHSMSTQQGSTPSDEKAGGGSGNPDINQAGGGPTIQACRGADHRGTSFMQLLSRRFGNMLRRSLAEESGEDLSSQRQRNDTTDVTSSDSVKGSLCHFLPTAIVDIQGYKVAGSFVLKSIALCDVTNFDMSEFHFKPPCPLEDLTRKDYETNRYIYNNLGTVAWNNGNYPYEARHRIISSLMTQYRRIYVKGQEKIRWLWVYAAKDIEIIDLITYNCPAITECTKDFHRWIQDDSELATFQNTSLEMERVVTNVLSLFLWIIKYRPDILPRNKKRKFLQDDSADQNDVNRDEPPIIFPLYVHLTSMEELRDIRDMLLLIKDLLSLDKLSCGYMKANDVLNENKDTVLHVAAKNNALEFMKMAIRCGCDIFKVNMFNQTPLDILKLNFIKGFLNKYPNVRVSIDQPKKVRTEYD